MSTSSISFSWDSVARNRLTQDGRHTTRRCSSRFTSMGYLNRIPSSRRLERETQRNVELMWLTGRLTPDFKTIADLPSGQRRSGSPSLPRVHRAESPDRAVVATPWWPSTAASSRPSTIAQELHAAQVDRRGCSSSSEEHCALSERPRPCGSSPDLSAGCPGDASEEKIATREVSRSASCVASKSSCRRLPISKSRSLIPMLARWQPVAVGQASWAYNVQAVVDTEHHMIVAHEVTNIRHTQPRWPGWAAMPSVSNR